MTYGDHWDEPATCHKCGQERSTHDDGYCEAVVRVFSVPVKRAVKNRALDGFQKDGEPNGGKHA